MASSTTCYPLNRGDACVCCRRRKMRCDGVKPICTPCAQGNRAWDCGYNVRKQPTRTQILTQKLAKLERRIRELESEGAPFSECGMLASVHDYGLIPGSSPIASSCVPAQETAMLLSSQFMPNPSSSVVLPASQPILSSSLDITSEAASPNTLSFNSSLAGTLIGTPPSLSMSVGPCYSGTAWSMPDLSTEWMSASCEFTNWMETYLCSSSTTSDMYNSVPTGYLSLEDRRRLLDIFYGHRHQCYFDVDWSRFTPLSGSSGGDEPHPALMNAIYLLACHFARSDYFTPHEALLYSTALHEITVALDMSDRLVDIIQALCLLAIYLFLTTRVAEGYRHAFTAARLALELGLHQVTVPNAYGVATAILLQPPRCAKDYANRVAAFWQVFVIDRTWSVVHGLPSVLPAGEEAMSVITTPLPWSMDRLDGTPAYGLDTLYYLNDMEAYYPKRSRVPVMRVLVSNLYQRAYHVAFTSEELNHKFYWQEHRALSAAVEQFRTILTPFEWPCTRRTECPSVDVELLSIHTMMLVAVMLLQKDFIGSHMDARQRMVRSGIGVTALLRGLRVEDFEFLDPSISISWLVAARMLKLMTPWLEPMASAMSELDSDESVLAELLRAVSMLGHVFPLAREHALGIRQAASETGNL